LEVEITHFNEKRRAHMINVSEEDDTKRIAIAKGITKIKRKL